MTFHELIDDLNLKTQLSFEKIDEDKDHITIGASCSTNLFENEFVTLCDIIKDQGNCYNCAIFFSFQYVMESEEVYAALAAYNEQADFLKAAIYPEDDGRLTLGVTSSQPLLAQDETSDYIVSVMDMFLSDRNIELFRPLLAYIKG